MGGLNVLFCFIFLPQALVELIIVDRWFKKHRLKTYYVPGT